MKIQSIPLLPPPISEGIKLAKTNIHQDEIIDNVFLIMDSVLSLPSRCNKHIDDIEISLKSLDKKKDDPNTGTILDR